MTARNKFGGLVVVPAILAAAGLAIYAIRRSQRQQSDDVERVEAAHSPPVVSLRWAGPSVDVSTPLLQQHGLDSYGATDDQKRPRRERDISDPSTVNSIFSTNTLERSTSTATTVNSTEGKLASSPQLVQSECTEVYRREGFHDGKISVASLHLSLDQRMLFGQLDAAAVHRVFARWTLDGCAFKALSSLTMAGQTFQDTDADNNQLVIDIGDGRKSFAMAVCAVDADGEHWDSRGGANYTIL